MNVAARLRAARSNAIVRSIGGVGAAALIAQAIGLAMSPFVARLFTQSDFGRFGLFFGLANVLATLAVVGLPDALLAPADEREARALLAGGAVCVVAASPLLAAITLGLVHFELFGLGELPVWTAWLMGFDVAAIGGVMLLQMWIIRRRRFRALAGGHVTLGIARSAGQLTTGSIGAGFLGLGLAEAVSRVAVVLVLMRSAREDLRLARSVSAREIRAALSRYRHFPLFRTPSTLANNVGTAMPAALVTMAYGVSATGLYTLMATVLVAPSGLVQKAVGDVFIGHFAHEFRTDRRRAQRFLLNVALALVVLSILPAVMLRYWGAPMFAVVFGERWRDAGQLAGIMVPVLVADFVIGPLGGALSVVNRPEAKLVFDALRLAGLVAAYALATHASAPLAGMMTYFAVFGVASYVVYGLLIYLGTAHPKPIAGPPLDLENGGATSLLDA